MVYCSDRHPAAENRSGIFLTANNAPLAVIKEEMKVNFGRDTPFTMVVCNLVCGFLNHWEKINVQHHSWARLSLLMGVTLWLWAFSSTLRSYTPCLILAAVSLQNCKMMITWTLLCNNLAIVHSLYYNYISRASLR